MYLTSNGTLTNSQISYLRDILVINFDKEYRSVPFMDFGCDSLIEDIRKKDAKIILESKIQEVIQRINSRNNLRLILDRIDVTNDGRVNISLSLGNLKFTQLL